MLITPLKVFASVQRRQPIHPSDTQELLVKKGPSSFPTLEVRNTRKCKWKAQYEYYKCDYIVPGEILYTEDLDKLVSSAIQGYSSTGVFTNPRTRPGAFDSTRANLTHYLLKNIRTKLNLENAELRHFGRPEIKLKYGYFGFCDSCCFDYSSGQAMTNEMAILKPLSALLRPMDHNFEFMIDSMSTVSARKVPSLLLFHFDDGQQVESTFAWVDLIPPKAQEIESQNYSRSYTEFESVTKILSNPNYEGTLKTSQYAMSHLLADYFTGSYQTMVFAHFDAYGCYMPGHDLDLLLFISQLQTIQCCVSRGRRSFFINTNSVQVKEYSDVKGILLKEYEAAITEHLKEIARLTDKVSSCDFLSHRLTTTKNSAHAAMERQNATTDIQLADMKHQITDLRAELVKSNASVNSFRYTCGDLELYLKEKKKIIKELNQLRDADAVRIEALEAQIKTLTTNLDELE
ncbi:unnamed protein product [Absidia cylindrospora]